ncbi:MAG: acyltransferase [Desulfarculaceae bacterium]|nr:acyltransferase [Desulfarculaceae bacterium]MCF8072105.1 acyltransferase [Desulfarculaceae bacterium]MCF8100026.1 acyltransferase [Desulfarculaceae bacterium]
MYKYVWSLLALLPSTRRMNRVRGLFLARYAGGSCGKLTVGPWVRVDKPHLVHLGDWVAINSGVVVVPSKHAPISVGDHTLIGPNCVLRSADHVYQDPGVPIRLQGHARAPISIERDCWLGAAVTVLQGVVIGQGSVVGANSVVNRSLPPLSVAMGAPAKVVKVRGRES